MPACSQNLSQPQVSPSRSRRKKECCHIELTIHQKTVDRDVLTDVCLPCKRVSDILAQGLSEEAPIIFFNQVPSVNELLSLIPFLANKVRPKAKTKVGMKCGSILLYTRGWKKRNDEFTLRYQADSTSPRFHSNSCRLRIPFSMSDICPIINGEQNRASSSQMDSWWQQGLLFKSL